MNLPLIARVCHEVNKAFCEVNGDHSQKNWDETEEWQKESSINGIAYALANNPTPAEQHMAWMQHKNAAGWVYGNVKDAVRKTHPCILPYEQLPEMQKAKDCLFLAVVNAFKQEEEKVPVKD